MNDCLTRTIGAANRQITFSPGESEYLRFTLNQEPVLCLNAATLGQFPERGSLLKKERQQETLDGLVARFEATLQVPFGTEPEIRRSVEFVDGFARIIEDYQPGRGGAFNRLELGDIVLPGPWKKVRVIPVPEAGQVCYFDSVQFSVEDKDNVFYDAGEPFLSAVFEREDGSSLEIGCGDDLWRWRIADSLEFCHAEFKISGNSEHIVLKRIPLSFHEGASPECVSRRFKWYFAWETHETRTASRKRKCSTLDLNKLDLPDSAAVADNTGKSVGAWCLEAAAVRRQLRKKLRSMLSNQNSGDLSLANCEPHVCASAAHLGRPGRQTLAHWDAWDMMELFVWANRRLVGSNRFFGIAPPARPAAIASPLLQRLCCRQFPPFSEK